MYHSKIYSFTSYYNTVAIQTISNLLASQRARSFFPVHSNSRPMLACIVPALAQDACCTTLGEFTPAAKSRVQNTTRSTNTSKSYNNTSKHQHHQHQRHYIPSYRRRATTVSKHIVGFVKMNNIPHHLTFSLTIHTQH